MSESFPPPNPQKSVASPEAFTMSPFYRWSLRLCFLVIILGLFSWGWSFLLDPWRFPVRHVQISGALTHVQSATLKGRILPYVSRGFFGVSVSGLRDHLLEMPWIEQVSIKRIWPDTLSIHLVEQQAVAHWGQKALLNPQGKRFVPADASALNDLPWLSGPAGEEIKVLKMYATMTELLVPLDTVIEKLALSPRQAWTLTLSNGLQLHIGSKEPLQRLQKFIAVYPELKQHTGKQAVYVDLRYNNGMAIRWESNAQSL